MLTFEVCQVTNKGSVHTELSYRRGSRDPTKNVISHRQYSRTREAHALKETVSVSKPQNAV
jgi:hypothetical protein